MSKGVIKKEDIFNVKGCNRFFFKMKVLLYVLMFVNKLTFRNFEKYLCDLHTDTFNKYYSKNDYFIKSSF
tara:strand:+ start:11439 stop:11648 length:210 start_codon:yes stop_codon:yes gene_type:complete